MPCKRNKKTHSRGGKTGPPRGFEPIAGPSSAADDQLSPAMRSIKIFNVTPFATKDFINSAFAHFGKIESSQILLDNDGKPRGKALVVYEHKNDAMQALKVCDEKCYFLSPCLVPAVVVSPVKNEIFPKGLSQKFDVNSFNPRFGEKDSLEDNVGQFWKSQYKKYKQEKNVLKRNMIDQGQQYEERFSHLFYSLSTAEKLEKELNKKKMELDKQRVYLEKKETELNEKETELEARKKKLKEQEQILMAREEKVALKEKDLPTSVVPDVDKCNPKIFLEELDGLAADL